MSAATIAPGTAHHAFPTYTRLPLGCVAHRLDDDRHAPHLCAGDFAVIDRCDRDFSHGELYLVHFANGARVLQAVRRPHGVEQIDGIWLEALDKTGGRSTNELLAGTAYLSDGPLRPECLADKLLGRVVGVYRIGAPRAAAQHRGSYSG